MESEIESDRCLAGCEYSDWEGQCIYEKDVMDAGFALGSKFYKTGFTKVSKFLGFPASEFESSFAFTKCWSKVFFRFFFVYSHYLSLSKVPPQFSEET